MSKEKRNKKSEGFVMDRMMRGRIPNLEILLSVSFALTICSFGMFYDFCGALWTVILSAAAIVCFAKEKTVGIQLTYGLCVSLVFGAGYLIVVPFAVDMGMAFLGSGRILWICPFVLLFQQLEDVQKQRFFSKIPWLGCLFTAVGLVSNRMPSMKVALYVNHRLGGPFQYPNTFALFLLVGIVILLHDQVIRRKNTICFAVLCIGIAASGSRTVMVLSIGVIILLTVIHRKWKTLAMLVLLGMLGACYILIARDTATIGRILRLSLSESTFVGRLLYARDALPLLLRHPFGMGHLGYYYSENMIQTGMYTVRYVHNDWLQIGLDIGWIPMLVYLLAILRSVLGRGLEPWKRWALAVIFLHGLLDFDLSYTVMLCLVLILMDGVRLKGKEKEKAAIEYRLPCLPLVGGMAVCVLVGGWLAIPAIAEYQGNDRLAGKFYPWDTEVNLRRISESDDIREVEQLADRVLKQNDTCSLAYYAKAFAAYCRDDYEGVIRWQREAIARDYFNYEVYMNYAVMLYDGMENAAEDAARAVCRTELRQIPELLKNAEDRLSVLGKKIQDQPELEPDEQMREILDAANKNAE